MVIYEMKAPYFRRLKHKIYQPINIPFTKFKILLTKKLPASLKNILIFM